MSSKEQSLNLTRGMALKSADEALKGLHQIQQVRPTREIALAITKLEEGAMWAQRAKFEEAPAEKPKPQKSAKDSTPAEGEGEKGGES